MDAQEFANELAGIPNVVAVALGGSRAVGTERVDSDWDFSIYYRGDIDANDVRALGYEGIVVEPGEWGPIVNGGAWLTIDRERVDVLYRELDVVERWMKEAEEGRYEVTHVAGTIAGLPTYVLAAELALGKVLVGELPRVVFPSKLRESAPHRWLGSASFSLTLAEGYAKQGASTQCVGSIARAALCTAHAILAERGEWVLNEKRIVQDAGLRAIDEILAAPGADPQALALAVESAREALGLRRADGLRFDEVRRG